MGGGGGNRRKPVYVNYGTFRLPDDYYVATYTGKAKIIYDVVKVLKNRLPPTSSQTNQQQ